MLSIVIFILIYIIYRKNNLYAETKKPMIELGHNIDKINFIIEARKKFC
jgi:hypothetical protein